LAEDKEASRNQAGDVRADRVVLLYFSARSRKLLPSAIPATSLGWRLLCREGKGLNSRGAML